MLSFFLRDVLDEIWDLIGSVSEGFSTYFYRACLARAGVNLCILLFSLSFEGRILNVIFLCFSSFACLFTRLFACLFVFCLSFYCRYLI